jgi:hypothetical protein
MASLSFSDIVSRTISSYANRGVTYRRYGQRGELQRMMVHRFPSEKLRGSVPWLTAQLQTSNALFRKLNAKAAKS